MRTAGLVRCPYHRLHSAIFRKAQNAVSVVTADSAKSLRLQKVTDKSRLQIRLRRRSMQILLTHRERKVRQAKLALHLRTGCSRITVMLAPSVLGQFRKLHAHLFGNVNDGEKDNLPPADITGAVSMLALLKGTGIPPIYQVCNNTEYQTSA